MFMQALLEFMGELNGNRVQFDPDNLVLTAGATQAYVHGINMLMYLY